MTEKRRWKAYVAIFAATAFVSAIVTPVAIMTFDNLACRTQPRGPDDFLAYCQSVRYGDYEHGALYYGLEPKVRESIRAAQVLFLGSSRLQAAFAANATREYFRARGIRYFVMGFGYGGASAFEQPVMERSGASPKVIVINADPFFVQPNNLSEPAREAIKGGQGYLWRLTTKMAFQRVQRIICRAVPLCPESEPSIFRSATDGQWNWIGPYIKEGEVPIDQEIKERLPQFEIERAKTIGEMFLNRIGLNRRCVVLTGIPTNGLNSTEVAKVLATALHTRFLAPKIDGIATVDRGHLNSRSAELWSAAFVEALTPIVNECLDGQLVGSRG
jgi:ferredoxin